MIAGRGRGRLAREEEAAPTHGVMQEAGTSRDRRLLTRCRLLLVTEVRYRVRPEEVTQQTVRRRFLEAGDLEKI